MASSGRRLPAKINLLLVEDNELDKMLLEEALSEFGLFDSLVHVSNGIEALKYLREEEPYRGRRLPDLILMDINMPLMNGHEALREIKSDPICKCIPVIMLTTSSRTEDVTAAYQEHSNSYIVKPDTYVELERVVASIQTYWNRVVQLPVIKGQ